MLWGGFLSLAATLAATLCACLIATRRAAGWSVTTPVPVHSPLAESLRTETGHVQACSLQAHRPQAIEYMTIPLVLR